MRRCLNCMNEYEDRHRDTCPHCGYVEGVTLHGDVCLRPGTILQGRYIVGTARKVRDNDILYIGWDALFDRKILLQEYFPRYCATRSTETRLSIYDSKQEPFKKGLELFIRQSRELIRLYQEPCVVTYYACFQENRTAYGVTECRDEQTLEEWAAGQNLGEREALAMVKEAILAVDAAHKVGVIHGMVGADTFWITRERRLVLKDFGAWRYVSGEPGVVNYGKAGEETDVYGLARLFCQLLTGKSLEDGDNLELDLLRDRVTLSRDVAAAIRHALSHETRSLYQFYQELGGKREEGTDRNFSRNRSRRRDAKSSFSVPLWVCGLAAAGLVTVAVAAGLIVTGVVRPRVNAEKSQMEADMVRVPNLIGMNEDEAEDLDLVKRGMLKLSKDKMVFDSARDPGIIAYQGIKENTVVSQGTEIVVYISKGGEKGIVPMVKGLQKEDAIAALEAVGFRSCKIKESQEEGQKNTVLAVRIQDSSNPDSHIQEGDQCPLDAVIELTVCARETETRPELAQVPDLSGMAQGEAKKKLEEAGFQVTVVEEFSDRNLGVVIRQEPEAGTRESKGAYVTLGVSKGPEKIYMKNVQLMVQSEAESTIREQGLTVGTVRQAYSDSVAAGKVISQSVAQDQEVSRGTSVDLTVSKGKDPNKTKEDNRRKQESSRQAEQKRQAEAASRAAAQSREAAAESSRQAEANADAEASRQAEASAEASRQAEQNGESRADGDSGQTGTGGQASGAENQGQTGTGGQSGAVGNQGQAPTQSSAVVETGKKPEKTEASTESAGGSSQEKADPKRDAVTAGAGRNQDEQEVQMVIPHPQSQTDQEVQLSGPPSESP